MNVRTAEHQALLQLVASVPPYMQSLQHTTRLDTYQPLQTINIEEESESDEDDEQKRTIFVANLDERVTEELLYEVFVQAGPIESVNIPKDASGKQRTFGFIVYVHSCTAAYAMRLYHGMSLFRKNLTIKHQSSKSSSGPPRRAVHNNGDSFNMRLNEYNAQRNRIAPPPHSDGHKNETSSMVRNPFNQQPPEWTKGTADKRSDNNDRNSRKLNDSPYYRKEARHGAGDGRGRDIERDRKDGKQKHFNGRQRNRRR